MHAECFVLELAILKEKEGRNITDAVFHGEVRFLIHINFDDLYRIAFFGGDFIKDRAEHFAGAAPFCPEIHDDRDGGLENFCGESGLGNLGNCGAGHMNEVGVG